MTEKTIGVLLRDEGWTMLDKALEPFKQKGPIGSYLYCASFEHDNQFAILTFEQAHAHVELANPMRIRIPLWAVSYIAEIAEPEAARKIGFV